MVSPQELRQYQQNGFLSLMQGYLGLGLVIGIARRT